jgi:hypothetical protein
LEQSSHPSPILALFVWLFIRYYIRGSGQNKNTRNSIVASGAEHETAQNKLFDLPHTASLYKLSALPAHSQRIAATKVVGHKPTPDTLDLGIIDPANLKSNPAMDDPTTPSTANVPR